MWPWTKLRAQAAEIQSLRQLILDADRDHAESDASLRQTIAELADTIRTMDQHIYNMSQCTDWKSMRPYFNQLQAPMEARKTNESNRITNILRKQLIATYAPRMEKLNAPD